MTSYLSFAFISFVSLGRLGTTVASVNAGGQNIAVASNQMVLTAQQLQLQLQKQAQMQQSQQQQQNMKLSSNQISVMNAQSPAAAVVMSTQDSLALPQTMENSPSGMINVGGFDKLSNNDGANVLIGRNPNQNAIVNVVNATLQGKHRRRSTPNDMNK